MREAVLQIRQTNNTRKGERGLKPVSGSIRVVSRFCMHPPAIEYILIHQPPKGEYYNDCKDHVIDTNQYKSHLTSVGVFLLQNHQKPLHACRLLRRRPASGSFFPIELRRLKAATKKHKNTQVAPDHLITQGQSSKRLGIVALGSNWRDFCCADSRGAIHQLPEDCAQQPVPATSRD